MMLPALRVVRLDRHHDRRHFHSGSRALDEYFKKQVAQDVRRRVAACFVGVSADGQVVGYYTLAASSVPLTLLPTDLIRKLPRYPLVPAVRMGRFAVDITRQRQGIGGALLVDALTRALHLEVAAYMLLVDAKDGAAANYYREHGFLSLQDAPLTLYLPLANFSEAV